MRGFAVLKAAQEESLRERYPLASKLWGAGSLIQPYTEEEMNFKSCVGARISIPGGFERLKVRRACRVGIKKYGHVVSRDYNVNYNPFFSHSCLIRAFDFFTVSLGCDLRLNEVVIADGASYEGRNAFRLLLPFARRIVLLTSNKRDLMEEVEYAIIRYGTSVAVLEDPVKACERADAVVLASDDPSHDYLLKLDRPMLFIRYPGEPEVKWWFDNILIEYEKYRNMETLYAQGYVDFLKKKPHWLSAEGDGFRISSLMRGDRRILER